MKKIIICLLIIFCLFSQNMLLAKKKKKPSEFEIEKQKQELEENLVGIAFSEKKLQNRTSMNYLLDNTSNNSYKALLELLHNNEVLDTHLVNIWNIFDYTQQILKKRPLTCEEIDALLKIQSSKPLFTKEIIQSYYNSCSSLFIPILESYLTSDDYSFYSIAITLTVQKQIINLLPIAIKNISTLEDSVKETKLLTLIQEMTSSNRDYDSYFKILLPLLKNNNIYVALKAGEIIANNPEFIPKLKEMFSDTDNIQEQIVLIKTLSYYKDSSLIDFILPFINKRPILNTNISSFLLDTTKTDNDFLKIVLYLNNLSETGDTLSFLNLIRVLLPQFIESNTIRENLLVELQKLEDRHLGKKISNNITTTKNIILDYHNK